MANFSRAPYRSGAITGSGPAAGISLHEASKYVVLKLCPLDSAEIWIQVNWRHSSIRVVCGGEIPQHCAVTYGRVDLILRPQTPLICSN